ncbi:MAG: hypothetical protein DRI86_03965 [Bacteroidetes bacterium]|nr:MAG: hypothetical protein DRI86_03965 [Bacteroidota bacterium]
MRVELREVVEKSDIKNFVDFPFTLYKNEKMWVPPIKDDEIKALKSETNPSFEFCDAKFWIVLEDRKVVGRIGAIINHKYNEERNEKMGRFTRFECIDDAEVAALLLRTAEEWIKSKEMVGVYGPLGFNNLDHQGMLIEGFEYLPSIASEYHMPYYQKLIEAQNYEKEIDWVEFRLTLGERAISKASRGAELIKKRYGITVKHFSSADELKPYIHQVFDILNGSFDVLPFVSKFDDKLADFYANKYLQILNPKFIKMVEKDDKIIGFILGMPSLSIAMQKAKGKLFPLGIVHIMKALKGNGIDTVDQMLTAVLKEYHSTGAAVVLQAELQNAMAEKGLKYIETTGIFETNDRAIKNWKNYEHIQHKRKRCFRKIF